MYTVGGRIVNIPMLCSFVTDIKNWIYNWDLVTLAIVVAILLALIVCSSIIFIKGLIGEKIKFKWFPFLSLVLLVAMLVIILLIRV